MPSLPACPASTINCLETDLIGFLEERLAVSPNRPHERIVIALRDIAGDERQHPEYRFMAAKVLLNAGERDNEHAKKEFDLLVAGKVIDRYGKPL